MFGNVYVIENLINDKPYVGQTRKDLDSYMKSHVNRAKLGSNRAIHNAIRKYGAENFVYYSLIKCHVDDLNEFEYHYIFELDSYRNGYNSTHGGDDNPMLHPDSVAKSIESKRAYIEAMGDNLPQKQPEYRKFMSDQQRKRMEDPAVKATISGKNSVFSKPDVKEKRRKTVIDKAKQGLWHTQQDDTKKKISDAHKKLSELGLSPSSRPEVREMISKNNKMGDPKVKALRKERSDKKHYKRRKHIFDFYYEHLGKLTKVEITKRLGLNNPSELASFQRQPWWKEMEEQLKLEEQHE